MKPVILCYEKCTTCKKALKWVEEAGYEAEVRPIKEENPTVEELKQWHEKSGLPLKRFSIQVEICTKNKNSKRSCLR